MTTYELIDFKTGECIRDASESDLASVDRSGYRAGVEAALGRKVLGTCTENVEDYRVAYVVEKAVRS